MQKFLEGMVCFLTEIPEHACLLIGMIGGEGETGGSEWGTVKGRASRERRETGVCGHVGDHGRLLGGGRGTSAVETKGRRLGYRWGTLCGLIRSLICISHAPDLHVPCLLGVLHQNQLINSFLTPALFPRASTVAGI